MLKGEEGQVFKIYNYESLKRILDWYEITEVEMQNTVKDDILYRDLKKAMERGYDVAFSKDCT